ncbi:MAG: hypothetical protein WCQ55_05410 [Paludibacteraceae bacterium]|nr:hypothetical protein [Prevotellaceae bacterium]
MKHIVYLFLITFCAFSCGDGRPSIDISQSKLGDAKIERFDVDFYNIDTNHVNISLDKIKAKHGKFTDLYLHRIIGIQPQYEDSTVVKEFLRHPAYRDIYNDCEKEFEEMADIEEQFTNAFKRFNVLFPQINIPKVYTHFSGFGEYIVVDEDVLSISLEYYLGSDYKNYKYIDGIYEYLTPNLRREKLVPDAIFWWLTTNFTYPETEQQELLRNIIYYGKIMYLTEALLPEVSEPDLMGYSKDQWEWCEANEAQMWNYMLTNKQLFSTEALVIAKYINPAPFTAYFPEESPGRTGIWMGWQIVKSFMKNNNDVNIQELMDIQNAQKILEASGYHPK